jgi:hypothetical protein
VGGAGEDRAAGVRTGGDRFWGGKAVGRVGKLELAPAAATAPTASAAATGRTGTAARITASV